MSPDPMLLKLLAHILSFKITGHGQGPSSPGNGIGHEGLAAGASPPAKTPGMFVVAVSGKIFIRPLWSIDSPVPDKARLLGTCPMASMMVST